MRLRLVLAAFLLAAFAAPASANPPFAYIANAGGNSVSVIDVDLATVVQTVTPVAPSPRFVAVNPAGNRVYVGSSKPAARSR